jgi:hypothetical protein
MGVGWDLTKEKEVRGGMVDDARGSNIQEIGCGVEGLDPEFWGKIGLHKESSEDVVDCAQHAFNFTVLW